MGSHIDGAFLRLHRTKVLDLGPREMAARLDISPGYLRNIEGGSNTPGPRLIGRIARAYRVEESQFVIDAKDDDDKTKDPTHPTRRQDREKTTGPKRDREVAA